MDLSTHRTEQDHGTVGPNAEAEAESLVAPYLAFLLTKLGDASVAAQLRDFSPRHATTRTGRKGITEAARYDVPLGGGSSPRAGAV